MEVVEFREAGPGSAVDQWAASGSDLRNRWAARLLTEADALLQLPVALRGPER
jgi:hypothetical protein